MSSNKALEAETPAYNPGPQGYSQPPPYGQPQAAYPPQGQMAYGQPQSGYVPNAQPQAGYVPNAYGQTTQSSVIVTQPGPPMIVHTVQQSDLTIPAVLVCLFCFWPVGICAIIQARNAQSAMYAGDTVTAQEKHRSARNLIISAVVCGIIAYVLIVVLRVVVYSSYYYSY